jgi:hypothetical protein
MHRSISFAKLRPDHFTRASHKACNSKTCSAVNLLGHPGAFRNRGPLPFFQSAAHRQADARDTPNFRAIDAGATPLSSSFHASNRRASISTLVNLLKLKLLPIQGPPPGNFSATSPPIRQPPRSPLIPSPLP